MLSSTPRPQPERPTVTDRDVQAYFAGANPGVMAISPQLFAGVKQQLQKLADEGLLTSAQIAEYHRRAAMISVSFD